MAGVGLCDPAAVRVLVDEGPAAVLELIDLGARFDRTSSGALSLTREGGHHRDRIAHAGGDATGAEIQRALVDAVLAAPRIEVIEHALVLDLLPTTAGAVGAVTLHVMGEGQLDGVGAVRARAVVLATGGIGQVYAATTNPPVSTGDGVAAALRAGAVVRDLEFVQFHPTVLWLGGSAAGQQPLVSEAVRGEGAFLRDGDGAAFMQGSTNWPTWPPATSWPRRSCAGCTKPGAEHSGSTPATSARRSGGCGSRRSWPRSPRTASTRSPSSSRSRPPATTPPAGSHRPVRPDLVPGLYACGEAACTGVHGANRLASNSLLEGLVFGRRIAADVLRRVRPAPGRRNCGIDVRGAGIAGGRHPAAAAGRDVGRRRRAARRGRA